MKFWNKILPNAGKKQKQLIAAILTTAAVISATLIFIEGPQKLSAYISETFFEKRLKYNKLEKLSVNASTRFFESVLGVPRFEINSPEGYKKNIFVDEDFFVQSISFENRVIFYSVTTRTKNFNPEFEGVKLGRTKFYDLIGLLGDALETIDGWNGPTCFGYTENFRFGRSTQFREFYFSFNTNGYFEDIIDSMILDSLDPNLNWREASTHEQKLALENFRKGNSINTFGDSIEEIDDNEILAFLAKGRCGEIGPDNLEIGMIRD